MLWEKKVKPIKEGEPQNIEGFVDKAKRSLYDFFSKSYNIGSYEDFEKEMVKVPIDFEGTTINTYKLSRPDSEKTRITYYVLAENYGKITPRFTSIVKLVK